MVAFLPTFLILIFQSAPEFTHAPKTFCSTTVDCEVLFSSGGCGLRPAQTTDLVLLVPDCICGVGHLYWAISGSSPSCSGTQHIECQAVIAQHAFRVPKSLSLSPGCFHKNVVYRPLWHLFPPCRGTTIRYAFLHEFPGAFC